MSDREEFEYWADEFDHNSDMWEDMGRDEIFMAGMRAARAQGGEAAPDGYAVVDSEGEFHFMIERGDYPEDSLFLCREHINDSESEGLDCGLEIKAVFTRKLADESKTGTVPK